MTKEATDPFIETLEKSIKKILSNPKASRKEKNEAIANGIKLAQIKHRISGGEQDGDFYGTDH